MGNLSSQIIYDVIANVNTENIEKLVSCLKDAKSEASQLKGSMDGLDNPARMLNEQVETFVASTDHVIDKAKALQNAMSSGDMSEKEKKQAVGEIQRGFDDVKTLQSMMGSSGTFSVQFAKSMFQGLPQAVQKELNHITPQVVAALRRGFSPLTDKSSRITARDINGMVDDAMWLPGMEDLLKKAPSASVQQKRDFIKAMIPSASGLQRTSEYQTLRYGRILEQQKRPETVEELLAEAPYYSGAYKNGGYNVKLDGRKRNSKDILSSEGMQELANFIQRNAVAARAAEISGIASRDQGGILSLRGNITRKQLNDTYASELWNEFQTRTTGLTEKIKDYFHVPEEEQKRIVNRGLNGTSGATFVAMRNLSDLMNNQDAWQGKQTEETAKAIQIANEQKRLKEQYVVEKINPFSDKGSKKISIAESQATRLLGLQGHNFEDTDLVKIIDLATYNKEDAEQKAIVENILNQGAKGQYQIGGKAYSLHSIHGTGNNTILRMIETGAKQRAYEKYAPLAKQLGLSGDDVWNTFVDSDMDFGSPEKLGKHLEQLNKMWTDSYILGSGLTGHKAAVVDFSKEINGKKMEYANGIGYALKSILPSDIQTRFALSGKGSLSPIDAPSMLEWGKKAGILTNGRLMLPGLGGEMIDASDASMLLDVSLIKNMPAFKGMNAKQMNEAMTSLMQEFPISAVSDYAYDGSARSLGSQMMSFMSLSPDLMKHQSKALAQRLRELDTNEGKRKYIFNSPDSDKLSSEVNDIEHGDEVIATDRRVAERVELFKRAELNRVAAGELLNYSDETGAITNARLTRNPLMAYLLTNGTLSDENIAKYKGKLGKNYAGNVISNEDLFKDIDSGTIGRVTNILESAHNRSFTPEEVKKYLLLEDGMVDFENENQAFMGAIRSPTGFGQFVARANYAKILRPVYEQLGLSMRGVSLNDSDLQSLAGADLDGDEIKKVFDNKYKVFSGIKIDDYINAINAMQNGDFVNEKYSGPSLVDAIRKTAEDYKKLDIKDSEKVINTKDLETLPGGNLVSNMANWMRTIELSKDATNKMGFYSSVGTRLSQLDLADPLMRMFAIMADMGNEGYDPATTLPKKPKQILENKALYQALRLGQEYQKIPAHLEDMFNVNEVTDENGNGVLYTNKEGLTEIDPSNVYRTKSGRLVDLTMLRGYDEEKGIKLDQTNLPSRYSDAVVGGLLALKESYSTGKVDDQLTRDLIEVFTKADENGVEIGYGNAGEQTKKLMQNKRQILAEFIGHTRFGITDEETDILSTQYAAALKEIDDEATERERTLGKRGYVVDDSGKVIETEIYKRNKEKEFGMNQVALMLGKYRAYINGQEITLDTGISKSKLAEKYGQEFADELFSGMDNVSLANAEKAKVFEGFEKYVTELSSPQEIFEEKAKENAKLDDKLARDVKKRERLQQINKEIEELEEAEPEEGYDRDAELYGLNKRLERKKFLEGAIQSRQKDLETYADESHWSIFNNNDDALNNSDEHGNESIYESLEERKKYAIAQANKDIEDMQEELDKIGDISEADIKAINDKPTKNSNKLNKLKQEREKLNKELSGTVGEAQSIAETQFDYNAFANAIAQGDIKTARTLVNSQQLTAAGDALRANIEQRKKGYNKQIFRNNERTQAQQWFGIEDYYFKNDNAVLDELEKHLTDEERSNPYWRNLNDEIRVKNQKYFAARRAYAENIFKTSGENLGKVLHGKTQEDKLAEKQEYYDKQITEAESALYEFIKSISENETPTEKGKKEDRDTITRLTSLLNNLKQQRDEAIKKDRDEYQYQRDAQKFQHEQRLDAIQFQGEMSSRAQQHQYDQYNRQRWAKPSRFMSYYYQQQDRRFDLETTYKQNEQQAKQMQSQIAQWQKEKTQTENPETIDALNKQIETGQAQLRNYQEAASAAEKEMEKFGQGSNIMAAGLQTIDETLGRVVSRLGRQIFNKALQETKQFVIQFNASMTEIQAITLKSNDEMAKLRTDTLQKAVNMHTSVSNVASTEAALYRQGLSDEEVSTRTEDVIKFASVAGIKVEAATKILTTALQNNLVGSATEAMDALVALGDNAATTAEDIGKAMQKCAAAANVAGVSYEELTAMLTTMTSMTQLSGTQVGTAMNTILSRMRQVTTSKMTKDQNGEVTTLSDVESALQLAGIDLREPEDKTQFRDISQVLLDIAKRWGSMSDISKANISTAVAGTRAGNMFQTLMEGMSEDNGATFERLLGLAGNSEGVTDQKYEVMITGIAASLDTLKSSWDALISGIESSPIITGGIDFLSGILQNLAAMPDSLKAVTAGVILLGTAIAAIIATVKTASLPGLGAILAPLAAAGTVAAGLTVANMIGAGYKNTANNSDEAQQAKDNYRLYKENNDKNIQSYRSKVSESKTIVDAAKKKAEEAGDSLDNFGKYLSSEDSATITKNLQELSVVFPDIASNVDTATSSLSSWDSCIQTAEGSIENLVSKTEEEASLLAQLDFKLNFGKKYGENRQKINEAFPYMNANDFSEYRSQIFVSSGKFNEENIQDVIDAGFGDLLTDGSSAYANLVTQEENAKAALANLGERPKMPVNPNATSADRYLAEDVKQAVENELAIINGNYGTAEKNNAENVLAGLLSYNGFNDVNEYKKAIKEAEERLKAQAEYNDAIINYASDVETYDNTIGKTNKELSDIKNKKAGYVVTSDGRIYAATGNENNSGEYGLNTVKGVRAALQLNSDMTQNANITSGTLLDTNDNPLDAKEAIGLSEQLKKFGMYLYQNGMVDLSSITKGEDWDVIGKAVKEPEKFDFNELSSGAQEAFAKAISEAINGQNQAFSAFLSARQQLINETIESELDDAYKFGVNIMQVDDKYGHYEQLLKKEVDDRLRQGGYIDEKGNYDYENLTKEVIEGIIVNAAISIRQQGEEALKNLSPEDYNYRYGDKGFDTIEDAQKYIRRISGRRETTYQQLLLGLKDKNGNQVYGDEGSLGFNAILNSALLSQTDKDKGYRAQYQSMIERMTGKNGRYDLSELLSMRDASEFQGLFTADTELVNMLNDFAKNKGEGKFTAENIAEYIQTKLLGGTYDDIKETIKTQYENVLQLEADMPGYGEKTESNISKVASVTGWDTTKVITQWDEALEKYQSEVDKARDKARQTLYDYLYYAFGGENADITESVISDMNAEIESLGIKGISAAKTEKGFSLNGQAEGGDYGNLWRAGLKSYAKQYSNSKLADMARLVLNSSNWTNILNSEDDYNAVFSKYSELQNYKNLADKDTVEAQNMRRRIELQISVSGIEDLEEAGSVMRGTAQLIEDLQSSGEIAIKAKVEFESGNYEQAEKYRSMLANGTEAEQIEAIQALTGQTVNAENYDRLKSAAVEISKTRDEQLAGTLTELYKNAETRNTAKEWAELFGYEFVGSGMSQEDAIKELDRIYGSSGHRTHYYNEEDNKIHYVESNAGYDAAASDIIQQDYSDFINGYYKPSNKTSTSYLEDPLFGLTQQYTAQELANARKQILNGELGIGNGSYSLYKAAASGFGRYGLEYERLQRNYETSEKSGKVSKEELDNMKARVEAAKELARIENENEVRETSRQEDLEAAKLHRYEQGGGVTYARALYKENNRAALAANKLYSAVSPEDVKTWQDFAKIVDIEQVSNWSELLSSAPELVKKFEDAGLVFDDTGKIDTQAMIDAGTDVASTLEQVAAIIGNASADFRNREYTSSAETIERAKDFADWTGSTSLTDEKLAAARTIYGDTLVTKKLSSEGLTQLEDDYTKALYQNYQNGINGLTDLQKLAGVKNIIDQIMQGASSVTGLQTTDRSVLEAYGSSFDGFSTYLSAANALAGKGLDMIDLTGNVDPDVWNQYAEALADAGISIEQVKAAQENLNNSLIAAETDLSKSGKYANEYANSLENIRKGGKEAQQELAKIRKKGLDLQDLQTAGQKAKGKAGKQLDTQTRNLLAGYLGIDAETLKKYTKEELAAATAGMEEAINEEFDQTVFDPVVQSAFDDINAALEKGEIDYEVDVKPIFNADGTVDWGALVALLQKINSDVAATAAGMSGNIVDYLVQVLTSDLENGGKKISVVSSTSGVKGKGSGGGYNSKGGGGGGGKSKVDKLLESQKHKLAEVEHNIKMSEIDEKRADTLNDYDTQLSNISREIELQRQLQEVYKANIDELVTMRNTVKADSDDWWKLTEAIQSAQQSMAEINNTIDDLASKKLNITLERHENEDAPLNHELTMQGLETSKYQTLDQFDNYRKSVYREMGIKLQQYDQNERQLGELQQELEDAIAEAGSESQRAIDARKAIWAIEEENYQLSIDIVNSLLEVQSAELAQAEKLLARGNINPEHNLNMLSTYQGIATKNEDWDKAREYIKAQNKEWDIIDKNLDEAIADLEEKMNGLSDDEAGQAQKDEYKKAIYGYREQKAQNQENRQQAISDYAGTIISELNIAYEEDVRGTAHNRNMLSTQAQQYLKDEDFEGYRATVKKLNEETRIQIQTEEQYIQILQKLIPYLEEQGLLEEARQKKDELNAKEETVQGLKNDIEDKDEEVGQSFIQEAQLNLEDSLADALHQRNMFGYMESLYAGDENWEGLKEVYDNLDEIARYAADKYAIAADTFEKIGDDLTEQGNDVDARKAYSLSKQYAEKAQAEVVNQQKNRQKGLDTRLTQIQTNFKDETQASTHNINMNNIAAATHRDKEDWDSYREVMAANEKEIQKQIDANKRHADSVQEYINTLDKTDTAKLRQAIDLQNKYIEDAEKGQRELYQTYKEISMSFLTEIQTALQDTLRTPEHNVNMNNTMASLYKDAGDWNALRETIKSTVSETQKMIDGYIDAATDAAAKAKEYYEKGEPEIAKKYEDESNANFEKALSLTNTKYQSQKSYNNSYLEEIQDALQRDMYNSIHKSNILQTIASMYKSADDMEGYRSTLEELNDETEKQIELQTRAIQVLDILIQELELAGELEAAKAAKEFRDKLYEDIANGQKNIVENEIEIRNSHKQEDDDSLEKFEYVVHKELRDSTHSVNMFQTLGTMYQDAEAYDEWRETMAATNAKQLEQANLQLQASKHYEALSKQAEAAGEIDIARRMMDSADQMKESAMNAIKEVYERAKQIQSSWITEINTIIERLKMLPDTIKEVLSVESELATRRNDFEAFRKATEGVIKSSNQSSTLEVARVYDLLGKLDEMTNQEVRADAIKTLSSAATQMMKDILERDSKKREIAKSYITEADTQRNTSLLNPNYVNSIIQPWVDYYTKSGNQKEYRKLVQDQINTQKEINEANKKARDQLVANLSNIERGTPEYESAVNKINEFSIAANNGAVALKNFTESLNNSILQEILDTYTRGTEGEQVKSRVSDAFGSTYQSEESWDRYRQALLTKQESDSVILDSTDTAIEEILGILNNPGQYDATTYNKAVDNYRDLFEKRENLILSQHQNEVAYNDSFANQVMKEYQDEKDAAQRRVTLTETAMGYAKSHGTEEDYQKAAEVYNKAVQDSIDVDKKYQKVYKDTLESMKSGTQGYKALKEAYEELPVSISQATSQLEDFNDEVASSKSDELIKTYTRRIDEIESHLTMLGDLASMYQEDGQLTNANILLGEENDLREMEIKLLDEAIAKLKEYRLAAIEAGTIVSGSDQDWALITQIMQWTEKRASDVNAQTRNNNKIRDNQKEIKRLKKELDDFVEDEIKNRLQTERDMLSSAVDLQEIIVETIRQRYREEEELIEKNLQKQKEALLEEKNLLSKRLQMRKDAMDKEDRYEKLRTLKEQLAAISLDSSRTKEAKAIREEIAKLERENAMSIAEAELDADTQRIDDQIDAIDDKIELDRERLEKYLEDANNFRGVVDELMSGSFDTMAEWLKENNKEYRNSLDEGKQQMLTSWEDTWKEMKHIIDTYWNEVANVLKDKNSFLSFFKQSDEYLTASENGREYLLEEYLDKYNGKIKALDSTASYNATFGQYPYSQTADKKVQEAIQKLLLDAESVQPTGELSAPDIEQMLDFTKINGTYESIENYIRDNLDNTKISIQDALSFFLTNSDTLKQQLSEDSENGKIILRSLFESSFNSIKNQEEVINTMAETVKATGDAEAIRRIEEIRTNLDNYKQIIFDAYQQIDSDAEGAYDALYNASQNYYGAQLLGFEAFSTDMSRISGELSEYQKQTLSNALMEYGAIVGNIDDETTEALTSIDGISKEAVAKVLATMSGVEKDSGDAASSVEDALNNANNSLVDYSDKILKETQDWYKVNSDKIDNAKQIWDKAFAEDGWMKKTTTDIQKGVLEDSDAAKELINGTKTNVDNALVNSGKTINATSKNMDDAASAVTITSNDVGASVGDVVAKLKTSTEGLDTSSENLDKASEDVKSAGENGLEAGNETKKAAEELMESSGQDGLAGASGKLSDASDALKDASGENGLKGSSNNINDACYNVNEGLKYFNGETAKFVPTIKKEVQDGMDGIDKKVDEKVDGKLAEFEEKFDDLVSGYEPVSSDMPDENNLDNRGSGRTAEELAKMRAEAEASNDQTLQAQKAGMAETSSEGKGNLSSTARNNNANTKHGYKFSDNNTGTYFDSGRIYETIEAARNTGKAQRDGVVRTYYEKGQKEKAARVTELKTYLHGGLVDYTGPAWVDGTKTRPESFLDAIDTENIRRLTNILSTVSIPSFRSLTDSIINREGVSSIGTINITINQAELRDDADFEYVARRVGEVFTKELSKQGFNTTRFAF